MKTGHYLDEKFVTALVEWIIDDLQAFSCVENNKFGKLLEIANPKFKIPCRQTIVNMIGKMYEEKKEKIKHLISLHTGILKAIKMKKNHKNHYKNFTALRQIEFDSRYLDFCSSRSFHCSNCPLYRLIVDLSSHNA